MGIQRSVPEKHFSTGRHSRGTQSYGTHLAAYSSSATPRNAMRASSPASRAFALASPAAAFAQSPDGARGLGRSDGVRCRSTAHDLHASRTFRFAGS